MNRIIVTGGSGFIGRPAVRDLVGRGLEVHATYLEATPPFAMDGVQWHRIDLMDDVAVERFLGTVCAQSLLHLAWYTVHGKFWRAPENLAWTAASLRLVQAFRQTGGLRVTVAGTCAEYDWSGDGLMTEATTPIKPHTLYGICKDALRRVLEAYAAESHLSWSWGRVFSLYGPAEHPARFVANVAGALVRGEVARMSHGRQVRDFLHVDDVAQALVALLLSDVRGTVNIASGVAISLGEVADELVRIAGKGTVERGAIPATNGEPPRLVADVARLRDEVGFRPMRPLNGGLAEMLRER